MHEDGIDFIDLLMESYFNSRGGMRGNSEVREITNSIIPEKCINQEEFDRS